MKLYIYSRLYSHQSTPELVVTSEDMSTLDNYVLLDSVDINLELPGHAVMMKGHIAKRKLEKEKLKQQQRLALEAADQKIKNAEELAAQGEKGAAS